MEHQNNTINQGITIFIGAIGSFAKIIINPNRILIKQQTIDINFNAFIINHLHYFQLLQPAFLL